MSKTFKRMLLMVWVLFGTIPMSLLWQFLWPGLEAIGVDHVFAQMVSMYSCVIGFLIVAYTISELPVRGVAK